MKRVTGKLVRCICVILSVVFVLLTLSGCGVKENNVYGNTVGNSNNSGNATIQGNWIYYTTKTGIYKVNGNKEPIKIHDREVNYLNVSGEWLYFRDANDGDIYKMKTDGTEYEMLLENVLNFWFADGWIYYNDRYFALHRMLPDKTQDTVVTEDVLTKPNLIDGKIYGSATFKIVECNLDGTDLKTIHKTGHTMFEVVVDGKYAYYIGPGTDPKKTFLTKVRLDGQGGPENIAENASKINIHDGWIYYVKDDVIFGTDTCIYKMNTDGTNEQKISEKNAINFCIVGDWIYYVGREYDENKYIGYNYYKMRLDGSDNQILE